MVDISWQQRGRRRLSAMAVAAALALAVGAGGVASADPDATSPWNDKLCAQTTTHPPAVPKAAAEGSPRTLALPAVPGGPVYGDPAASTRYWQMQSQNDCALMAMRIALAELNHGHAPTEAELVQLATHTDSDCTPGAPVYDITLHPEDDPLGSLGHGVCPGDLPKLLKHYGVQSTATNDVIATRGGSPTGMPTLLTYLAQGQKVIAGVNCETLWDVADGDHTGGDHAILVAAVDTSKNLVYLGDTGGPDTRGEQVTIDAFEAAWVPGEHAMIVTEPPA